MAGKSEVVRTTHVSSEREIVLTRIFDAPRDLVWKAWTDPSHVAEWWGPRGFETRVTELDLRPGGRWRYVMVGPDGAEYPVTGMFREVVPKERFVTSDEFDEGFAPPGGMDLPRGIVLTCLFEDSGPKTKLTLRILHASAEDRRKHEEMGVVAGWASSFECLDEHLPSIVAIERGGLVLSLPSDREIMLTRAFDAPRRIVFEAWTKPEHVRHWWGLRRQRLSVCEIDLRPGGSWRYVLSDPDGSQFEFRGVYREIAPPERLVYTERFVEPNIGSPECVTTVTFEERGEWTTMTSRAVYESKAARDGHLQSGMEEGSKECLDRLAERLRAMM